MDICKYTEMELISKDCNTMRTIGLNIRDSIFSMMIVPFYAIAIRGFEDYWETDLLDTESKRKVYDLRNSLKIYQDKFRRIKIRFLDADETSDLLFKNQLRFEILKKFNIHYNLGIYVTDEGKIVGNTQWIDSYFQLNKEPSEEVNNKSFDIGYMIGSAIQKACNMNELLTLSESIQLGDCPRFGYIDFNTNRNSSIFRGSWDKEVQLAFLHLLSLINFEKYVLEKVLPIDNEWLFRIKYVVIHYALSGIEQIYRHCNADNKMDVEIKNLFQTLLDDRWTFFPSEFRGCMMHYRLSDKENRSLIKEELFDERLPFNGLIESIFHGLTFNEYNKILSSKRDEMELFLESQFNIDKQMIKYDL